MTYRTDWPLPMKLQRLGALRGPKKEARSPWANADISRMQNQMTNNYVDLQNAAQYQNHRHYPGGIIVDLFR